MSENQPNKADEPVGPEAVVEARHGISLVWIIPVVAAIIGAALAFQTISQRGPLITITFDSAIGIEAGKTPIRYRAVDVGLVETVDIAGGAHDHIVVTARINKSAEKVITETARFWVVRPRLGAAGFSGLSTLVSGSYIAMGVGKDGAKKQRSFTGLEDPEYDTDAGKGQNFILSSASIHGMEPGVPVFFRGLQIGEVISDKLSEDEKSIEISVRIEEAHLDLIHTNSRFRDASGLSFSAGLDGVEMHMESVVSLIIGGIVVDTPGSPGPAASPGTKFPLLPAHDTPSAKAAAPTGLHIVAEAHRLGSVQTGDHVYYREEKVGEVVSHELNDDATSVGVHIVISEPYDRLIRTDTVFWNASGIRVKLGFSGVKVSTESLESMLKGGIAFATPSNPGGRVKAGSVFKLHTDSDKSWFDWKPRIWLGQGTAPTGSTGAAPSKTDTEPGDGSPAQADPTGDDHKGDSAAEPAKADPVDYHHKGDSAGAKGSTHHWYPGPTRPRR